MVKNVFLFIFLNALFSSNAQNYEGKIGNYEIYFNIDISNPDYISAFYFYKSKLKNINLEGELENDKLTLYKTFSSKEEKNELFTLKVNDNKIKGYWQHKSKVLKVNLTKTSKNIKEFKTSHLIFIKDSVSNYNDKQIIWCTEKYSKILMFKLGKGFSNEFKKSFNSKAKTKHIEIALIELECEFHEINQSIQLLSNTYLSFSINSSNYCGGAHPSYATTGETYNIKTNTMVTNITDIYPNINYYNLLKTIYKDSINLQTECDYFNLIETDSEWEYKTWYLNKNGIVIVPSYSHVMKPCEIEFIIPYNYLSK